MTETVTIEFDSRGSGSGDSLVQEIPRELGHVRLLEEIGRGGMGVVWRGMDSYLRREVAVKLMKASDDGGSAGDVLFTEGARAAAAIKHANVVSVYHADEVDSLRYLVMEYVDGLTLRQLLDKRERLQQEFAALAFAKTAAALAAIHEQQVVHCDIKPSNILFNGSGELLVSDFGLSHVKQQEQVSLGVRGTPPYMAPEMFDGEQSFQSDVYAVGVMFYELLTGERPFQGPQLEDYKEQHREWSIPESKLAGFNNAEAVIDLIQRATHKQKMFRYKSAFHLHEAIERAYPSISRDSMLDSRFKQYVLETASGRSGVSNPTSESAPAATYFDLLSKRADEKRQKKADDSDHTM